MSLAVAAAMPCGGTAQVTVADPVVRTDIAWPFDRIWTAVMNARELFGKPNGVLWSELGLIFGALWLLGPVVV